MEIYADGNTANKKRKAVLSDFELEWQFLLNTLIYHLLIKVILIIFSQKCGNNDLTQGCGAGGGTAGASLFWTSWSKSHIFNDASGSTQKLTENNVFYFPTAFKNVF